jgi:hypothetical protein
LVQAATRRRSRRSELLWAAVPLYAGIPADSGYSGLVGRTLERRARIAARSAERVLHRLGVRVEKFSPDTSLASNKSVTAATETPTAGGDPPA